MKSTCKFLAFFFFLIIVSPLVILFYVLSTVFDRDELVRTYSQFFSLFPGIIGAYIRKAALSCILRKCDRDAFVGFGVLFSHYNTNIGKGVYIGPYSNIGSCEIHPNCLLGSGVHIMSGSKQHKFDDINIPIREQGGEFNKVEIGEDCWIGNAALIMANVGKKCIVAAGAVVTSDVCDYAVVAGNPARIVRMRNADN